MLKEGLACRLRDHEVALVVLIKHQAIRYLLRESIESSNCAFSNGSSVDLGHLEVFAEVIGHVVYRALISDDLAGASSDGWTWAVDAILVSLCLLLRLIR